MHELSIAESILSAVQAELEQRPGSRALRVGVKIGSMAAVDADSLQFCFQAIVQDSEWGALKLITTVVPAQRMCAHCSHQYTVADFKPDCPACGSAETMPIGGDELDLEFLELDGPETEEQLNAAD